VTGSARRQRELERSAAPLFHRGRSSTGDVRYTQLGGRRPDYVAVMVVVEQRVGRIVETRTLDIRVRRRGEGWAFDQLASAGGDSPGHRAVLSDEAIAVLTDPRITLSDSARWDIERGIAAPSLLRVMRALAKRTSFAVSAIASGHPTEVIASGRPSTHAVGLAADIYVIGGDTVSPRSPVVLNAVRWLSTRPEVAHLGSPWELGPRTFTDPVHQDHIHLGVAPG
jgi:hypothetical protein